MPIFITDKSKSVLPSIYDEIYLMSETPAVSFDSTKHHIVNDIFIRDSTTGNQADGTWKIDFPNSEWRFNIMLFYKNDVSYTRSGNIGYKSIINSGELVYQQQVDPQWVGGDGTSDGTTVAYVPSSVDLTDTTLFIKVADFVSYGPYTGNDIIAVQDRTFHPPTFVRDNPDASGVFETYVKQGNGPSGTWEPTLYEEKSYKISGNSSSKTKGFYNVPKGVFHIEIMVYNPTPGITNVDIWVTNWSSDTEYSLIDLQTYDPTVSVSTNSNTTTYVVNVKPFMYLWYEIDPAINITNNNYIVIKQNPHILETIT
jgi:hypothetical protein